MDWLFKDDCRETRFAGTEIRINPTELILNLKDNLLCWIGSNYLSLKSQLKLIESLQLSFVDSYYFEYFVFCFGTCCCQIPASTKQMSSL